MTIHQKGTTTTKNFRIGQGQWPNTCRRRRGIFFPGVHQDGSQKALELTTCGKYPTGQRIQKRRNLDGGGRSTRCLAAGFRNVSTIINSLDLPRHHASWLFAEDEAFVLAFAFAFFFSASVISSSSTLTRPAKRPTLRLRVR